jgi:hypothetical protein
MPKKSITQLYAEFERAIAAMEGLAVSAQRHRRGEI